MAPSFHYAVPNDVNVVAGYKEFQNEQVEKCHTFNVIQSARAERARNKAISAQAPGLPYKQTYTPLVNHYYHYYQ